MENQPQWTRPDVLEGPTRKLRMGCGKVYITVNRDAGLPREVFVRLGKAGSCQHCQVAGQGRLASIALQMLPLDREGFVLGLDRVAKTMIGMSCSAPQAGLAGEVATSCLDGLGKMLRAEGLRIRSEMQAQIALEAMPVPEPDEPGAGIDGLEGGNERE